MLKNWLTATRLKWLGVALVAIGLLGNVWLLTSFQNARAADCDDNAVIRCGVNGEAAVQMKCAENANNTQAIFQEFGITCHGLQGLVAGQVTSDNKVYVKNGAGGFDLVGTDAVTAGRQKIGANDQPIAGGAAYKRPPSVSFVSSPLSALVKMDGSKFLFAVIMSCGNPVVATPTASPPPQQPQQPAPPPPSYEIAKTVRLAGQGDWQENVVVKPGDHVEFRLVMKNTGQTALDNTEVSDSLPDGLTWVDGSLVSNGVKQPDGNLTKNRLALTHFAAGATVTMTFEATANDVEVCGNNYLTNYGIMQPPDLNMRRDTATVQICKPSSPPPQTPPAQTVSTKPTELTKTGAGDMGVIFTLTTAGCMALYQFYVRKKAA